MIWMSQKKKHSFRLRIFGGLLALMALGGGVLYLAKDTITLHVINRDRHKVIFSQDFQPGQKFSFMYIHSVQKTPVFEVYTVDAEGRVMLLETKVRSFGYGLPAPRQGENYRIKDGYLQVREMNRLVDRLLIRVNFVRLMELRLGPKALDLRKYGRGGDLIEVSAKRTSRLCALMGM